jgi:diguanylate cyclase (GGDEF)-like protein
MAEPLTASTTERHMLSALNKAAGYYEVRGDYDTAITYTQRQVNLDPLDESARRKLIELFHKSGRRSLALEQYQVCVRILADELGVEPAPETVALYQRIKQGTVPLPRQGARQAQALPSDLTSFAGREAELARFARCLGDSACRLLTVVGLPGAGKTRLALKVASQSREIFDDGALFFSLENVSKPDQLAPALLQGLGLSRQSGQDPEEQLLEHLSGRSALLVLDSFENLLGGTRLLIRILQNAPRVKFLVTSRRHLNYQASCLFEVGGLPYPEDARDEQVEEYPAVQMFLNRAIHSRPGFLASALTLPQIVRICKAVEGNPLALELAAANLRQYSCEHIASSLESSLSILTTGLQDIPPRHRSMLKTLDEFWSQLEPHEAEAAQALSALTGRFDEQEADQLLGASRPVLAHLVEKSVLVREQHGGFQMPALLRRYAQETALKSTSLDGPPDKPEADRWDSPFLYDPATGLVSRELFWDRLNHLLAREKRRRGVFGVAVLDLFADPDAFGLTPSEKEAAIEIAAERLAARLRASDTVARLGRDEFGLVIEDIDQGGGLEAVPQKIQSVLQEAVVIGGRVISLPVRIGLSLFPADGSEARDLVDNACQARDRVEGGGPLYRYYSDRLGIKR